MTVYVSRPWTPARILLKYTSHVRPAQAEFSPGPRAERDRAYPLVLDGHVCHAHRWGNAGHGQPRYDRSGRAPRCPVCTSFLFTFTVCDRPNILLTSTPSSSHPCRAADRHHGHNGDRERRRQVVESIGSLPLRYQDGNVRRGGIACGLDAVTETSIPRSLSMLCVLCLP